jgi:hypothetical protein
MVYKDGTKEGLVYKKEAKKNIPWILVKNKKGRPCTKDASAA